MLLTVRCLFSLSEVWWLFVVSKATISVSRCFIVGSTMPLAVVLYSGLQSRDKHIILLHSTNWKFFYSSDLRSCSLCRGLTVQVQCLCSWLGMLATRMGPWGTPLVLEKDALCFSFLFFCTFVENEGIVWAAHFDGTFLNVFEHQWTFGRVTCLASCHV